MLIVGFFFRGPERAEAKNQEKQKGLTSQLEVGQGDAHYYREKQIFKIKDKYHI